MGRWIFQRNFSESLVGAFWIHAASGEIEYARPLIRELKKKHPLIPIVVTYSSPSAQRILQNLDEVSAWGPSPWDLFWSCGHFLDRLRPRCAFFARTDVWPELIAQASARRIPSVLFSATFSTESSRLKGVSKFLTAGALKKLSKIFVVDQGDLDVLWRAGIHISAEISGDTRYDQVFRRLEAPQNLHQHLQPFPEQGQNKKILIAGSTWPEDEAILFEWYKNHSHEVMLILAPHEVSPARLQQLQTALSNMGISCDFYSSSPEWKSPVLILDQMGILAELYTWADWAFVGGSFRRQVHSVMEPLAAGLHVWVGPFHHNNREALFFKKQHPPLVIEIHTVPDFEKSWSQLKTQLGPDSKKTVSNRVNSLQGATPKLLRWVENLPKTSP